MFWVQLVCERAEPVRGKAKDLKNLRSERQGWPLQFVPEKRLVMCGLQSHSCGTSEIGGKYVFPGHARAILARRSYSVEAS